MFDQMTFDDPQAPWIASCYPLPNGWTVVEVRVWGGVEDGWVLTDVYDELTADEAADVLESLLATRPGPYRGVNLLRDR